MNTTKAQLRRWRLRQYRGPVSEPATINPRIIESLYCEALVLADEVRCAFTLSGRLDEAREEEDLARVALSCEALRATTRMMNAIAWLLNYRAFFMGELSEFQLRRYGRLQPDPPASDPSQRAMLSRDIRELVSATERFHARLTRIDARWREAETRAPSAVARLRQRIEGRPAR